MKSYFFYTDQLTVGYDGKPLIKEINIQLNKGEILTLIGPNGAGKSTILKSITRQLSLIGGTVYLEQEQMSRMTNKEVSRKLAVVLTERMRPELMRMWCLPDVIHIPELSEFFLRRIRKKLKMPWRWYMPGI